MFLTPGEIAFGGVALGGVISYITAKETRSAALAQNLWDKRSAAYEDSLMQSREMQQIRANVMRSSLTATDSLDLRFETDPASLRRIEVRLSMFGSSKVRTVHAAMVQADRNWISEYVGMRALQDEAARNTRGELPPGTGPSGRQVVDQRHRAESAQQAADSATDYLTDVIARELTRPPRFQWTHVWFPRK